MHSKSYKIYDRSSLQICENCKESSFWQEGSPLQLNCGTSKVSIFGTCDDFKKRPSNPSPQEKLWSFCITKFHQHLNAPHAFTYEDHEDILSWSDEDAETVIQLMDKGTDNTFCPWCIYARVNRGKTMCHKCSYGERHGQCENSGSTYNSLIIGFVPLVVRLNNKADEMLKALKS